MTDYIEKRFNFIYPTELNMYYCGKRYRSENHIYGPAIRNHFLLVYIQEGTAVLSHKSSTHIMSPGHILCMFPDEKIYYKVSQNSPWSILWIGVYGKLVYDFLSLLDISPQKPIFKCPDPEYTESILEQILSSSEDTSLSGKLLSLSLIYTFFSSLTKNIDLPHKSESALKTLQNNDTHEIIYSSDKIVIRDAENFIRFHYDSNITVNDIAKNVNLDPFYFSKLFKRETGLSPKQKINEYRINRACLLLENSSLSIAEIAHCIGMDDAQYFSRFFKKQTGLSPKVYRQMNYQKSND
ncbi:MAG TPA: AraC family transcriptional regulator [Candidatus Eisenbergiella merdipullorum]|uniref:AraC family transcriptional regulator n=1 Tax=Candidatus Eisenbergiella merdipullorum TaxID=2838553 RepID=A0A9D2I9M5_9FIRM|nr:AraC family transcriptional regulator [Candidatus Eisenbergiella merdipullorum]